MDPLLHNHQLVEPGTETADSDTEGRKPEGEEGTGKEARKNRINKQTNKERSEGRGDLNPTLAPRGNINSFFYHLFIPFFVYQYKPLFRSEILLANLILLLYLFLKGQLICVP